MESPTKAMRSGGVAGCAAAGCGAAPSAERHAAAPQRPSREPRVQVRSACRSRSLLLSTQVGAGCGVFVAWDAVMPLLPVRLFAPAAVAPAAASLAADATTTGMPATVAAFCHKRGIARHSKVHAIAGMQRRRAELRVLCGNIRDRRVLERRRKVGVERLGVVFPLGQHAGRPDPDELDALSLGRGDDRLDLRLLVGQAADGVVGAEAHHDGRAARHLLELVERLAGVDRDIEPVGGRSDAGRQMQALADAVADDVHVLGERGGRRGRQRQRRRANSRTRMDNYPNVNHASEKITLWLTVW